MLDQSEGDKYALKKKKEERKKNSKNLTKRDNK